MGFLHTCATAGGCPVESLFNPNLTRPASYGHFAAGLLGFTSIYALRVLAVFLARMMYRSSIYGFAVLIDNIIHIGVVILSVAIIVPMVAFSGVQVQRAVQLYRNQIPPSSCRYVDELLVLGSVTTIGTFLVLNYFFYTYHVFELQVSLFLLVSICIANAVLLWLTLRIPANAERLGVSNSEVI